MRNKYSLKIHDTVSFYDYIVLISATNHVQYHWWVVIWFVICLLQMVFTLSN